MVCGCSQRAYTPPATSRSVAGRGAIHAPKTRGEVVTVHRRSVCRRPQTCFRELALFEKLLFPKSLSYEFGFAV